MRPVDLISDPDVLSALTPDELGLRMLPVLATWQEHNRARALTVDTLIITAVGDGRGYSGQYPSGQITAVEQAIREAWAWLEGSAFLIKDRGYREPNHVRSLSRRAQQLSEEPDARKVLATHRIPKEALHPSVREDVWALYQRSKHDTAVFEATKAVEVAVRTAAGLKARDIGAPLMRKAFDPKNGPLTDMDVDEAEREARAHLFAGVIGSYKNPQSRRNVALDDSDEAAEIIMLANHLLRIVDSRRLDDL